MTSAQIAVPADVAGPVPDVGGVSNEPVHAPVSATLPTRALSDAAGALLIPATVAAGVASGLALRWWVW